MGKVAAFWYLVKVVSCFDLFISSMPCFCMDFPCFTGCDSRGLIRHSLWLTNVTTNVSYSFLHEHAKHWCGLGITDILKWELQFYDLFFCYNQTSATWYLGGSHLKSSCKATYVCCQSYNEVWLRTEIPRIITRSRYLFVTSSSKDDETIMQEA